MTALAFILAIVCYAISQLANQNKIRWAGKRYSFWGEDMDKRKYKSINQNTFMPVVAPDNFYYKYIARVKYKERWFTSTNLTVMFTDGYHASQHVSFFFLSIGIWSATGWSFFEIEFWNWFVIWGGILATHFVTYRTLQR